MRIIIIPKFTGIYRPINSLVKVFMYIIFNDSIRNKVFDQKYVINFFNFKRSFVVEKL